MLKLLTVQKTESFSKKQWNQSVSPVFLQISQLKLSRHVRLLRESASPLSSVPLSPLAAQVAVLPTTKKSLCLLYTTVFFSLPSIRFLLKNISTAGKKLNLKQCVTAQVMLSQSAQWKTLTPSVFIQVTVSLLLPLLLFQTKSS